MTVSDPLAPQDRPRRPSSSPQFTEAEKLAAQWEARHDAAARGHRPDPLAVQQYLGRLRSDEHRSGAPREAAGGAPAAAPAGQDGPAGPGAPDAPASPGAPRAGRPWWRRLPGIRRGS